MAKPMPESKSKPPNNPAEILAKAGKTPNGTELFAKAFPKLFTSPDKIDKKTPSRLKSFRRWLKRTWSDEDSTLRRSTSVLTLIVYSFLGSVIFYGIESDKHSNYWQCLSYVNSIFTTIGYGKIKPETISGKIFTMFYAILGVPIMMIAASDLGLIMMYWTGKAWIKIRRIKRFLKRVFCGWCLRHNSIAAVIPSDDSIYEKGQEEKMPLSFAVFILILWLLLSSFYFLNTNPTWNFFIAFYFFFISVSTIGLGDYTTREDQSLTIPDYMFIIGGISLFSLCVRLFVQKIESVDDKVAQQIINEYIESLQSQYAFDSSDGHMEESESKQRALIRRMIRKKGGCMRFFIGKRVEAKMLREYQKRANLRLKMTQTMVCVRNVSLEATPNVCDAQTMAGESFIVQHKFKPKHPKRKRRHSPNASKKDA